MAAAEPEILISQLVDVTAVKFRRLYLCFCVPAIQRCYGHHCANKPEVKNNPRWRPLNRKYFCKLRYDYSRFGSAAILKFPLPVWSYSIASVSIRLLDLENGGLAEEMWLLTRLQAKIRVLSHRWRPSWIFHFRFGRTLFQVFPVDC